MSAENGGSCYRHFPFTENDSGLKSPCGNRKYCWLYAAKPDCRLTRVAKPIVKAIPLPSAVLRMWSSKKELDRDCSL